MAGLASPSEPRMAESGCEKQRTKSFGAGRVPCQGGALTQSGLVDVSLEDKVTNRSPELSIDWFTAPSHTHTPNLIRLDDHVIIPNSQIKKLSHKKLSNEIRAQAAQLQSRGLLTINGPSCSLVASRGQGSSGWAGTSRFPVNRSVQFVHMELKTNSTPSC